MFDVEDLGSGTSKSSLAFKDPEILRACFMIHLKGQTVNVLTKVFLAAYTKLTARRRKCENVELS